MEYRGFVLDRFQEEAITHLQAGRSVLVAAPTGTGKTIIADWIVEEALRTGKKVVYTAPIKALSNQKFRDYTRLHGDDKVGLVTGDLVIRRDAPCLVMTTEILRNILLQGDSTDELLAVIIDEVHFLDDRERGTVWEETLIYLPPTVQIVALSATLPNLDDFASWLRHVRGGEVEIIKESTRSVPLDMFFFTRDRGLMQPDAFEKFAGGYRPKPSREKKRGRPSGRGGRSRDEQKTSHIDIFKALRERDWLPYLYFVFSRRDAERLAKALAFRFRVELLDEHEYDRCRDILDEAATRIGTALDTGMRDMYLRGIGFHHAGLHVQLKALVEQLYEEKLIKVLYCTSTFALGINMPARSVVFHGLMKYDGRGVNPLTTRGFMQKAGRAGRRGMDEAGHVVLRMDPEEYGELRPVIKRYRQHDYEPVRSSFSLSWNSVVNLLEAHEEEHIREIVEKSFLNWHLRQEADVQLKRAAAIEARPEPTKGAVKEARRLRRRAERSGDRCWDEFEHKKAFLERAGYLKGDGRFNAGAKVLQNIQINEIFTTELVLEGLLDMLDGPDLFGVLCMLTNDLPRAVTRNFGFNRKDRELIREIERVRWSDAVVHAEEITEIQTTFCPDLLPVGRAWANGQPLDEVLLMLRSTTDWSGSLVTGFRRAKDLASQLRDVYSHDEERRSVLKSIMKAVSRDEVEVVD